MQQGVARTTELASTLSIQPALVLLEKTPILLETMLRDLPEELMRWKPAPERWSIAEVLSHLADIEEVYADRTRRIVTEETPTLPKYDATGTIVIGDYARGSANEILAYFIRTRRSTVILLRSIPADSGGREATHAELGTITLHEMLSEWASHDLGHLRQIAELYRARAFHPHAGPFQRYSNPKP
ncbi:MAG: DinB family protein [Candidatus Acidiferrum sp.]